jgi:hypothetical protein
MANGILAHLMGESWHVADLLLYGGAGVGLVGGVGLFLWGRQERQAAPSPQPQKDEQRRPQSLIKHD